MDIKTRILRWEHDFEENPAILVLIIIAAVTGAFILTILIDAYIKRRKKRKHKRG